ncbi:MAG: triose-phosphate isomerase [Candidatus Paceibacterota bacterium]
MKKYIVSNWKNHPDTLAEAEQILNNVDEYLGSLGEKELSLVFCPPFVFTEEVGKTLRISHLAHQAELGAQDISADDKIALTGEVTGPMLKKLGVRYVIVGHSERRWKLGESDEIVNQKLKVVLENELVPIVCLGERVRDADFKEFLRNQTEATFAGLSSDQISRCIIAYEPVWAISSNPGSHPDTPQSALESVDIIKRLLIEKFQVTSTKSQTNSKFQIPNSKPLFLYGGSITSANSREFLSNDGFDGVLVGSASVNKDEFVRILSIVQELDTPLHT